MRKSIPVFGVIVTAMLLLSMTVYAEDEAMTFSSDEYEYTVDENGYATLTKYVGVDTDVAVPDSIDGHIVTGLGDSVFYVQQTEIRSIQLSRDIRDLGAYVFLSDTLQNITVDPENNYFTSIDGVLYSKDESEISAYPIGRTADEYMIQDGVTTIGSYAFYAGRNLKKVDIPDTVLRNLLSSCVKIWILWIFREVLRQSEKTDSTAATSLKSCCRIPLPKSGKWLLTAIRLQKSLFQPE